ncbi:hypothetical protein VCHENC02_2171B, partial [Vibrio harveyi]
NRLLLMG